MQTWAKSDTFSAGQLATRQFQLGPDPEHVGTCKPILHGSLRVGFKGDEQAPEQFTGTIILPDDGGVIGPIDLPFEVTVELPLLVKVTPSVAPAADRDVIATVSTPPLKLRWAATRRVFLPAGGGALVIPQWVHSVSVCEVDAAVTMFDALGNVLCAITGPVWDVPRPRAAVLIATTAANGTAVLYSFQA